MSAPRDDRRVHARTDMTEVVRYARSGKWYWEQQLPVPARLHVGVREAARIAVDSERYNIGAEVFTGVPGGSAFDRAVAVLRAERGLLGAPGAETEGET